MPAKRVVIFDSGVGGLSVYEQIVKINPSIECRYLFDNAYFPYGELPRKKLINRITQLLTDFTEQYPADLIVIACNSASTIALDDLRSHFTIPIVGVVPAIKPATLITKNNVIGLLATPGTVERAYTSSLIEKFAVGKKVLRIGSTKLVTLAEDKLMGKIIEQEEFNKILAPWSSAEQDDIPDTLVLGCTHFPLLKEEIAACFSKPVQLVDSGEAIALRVQQLLANELINNESTEFKLQTVRQAFYTKVFVNLEHLSELQKSFYNYSFESLNFYDL